MPGENKKNRHDLCLMHDKVPIPLPDLSFFQERHGIRKMEGGVGGCVNRQSKGLVEATENRSPCTGPLMCKNMHTQQTSLWDLSGTVCSFSLFSLLEKRGKYLNSLGQ